MSPPRSRYSAAIAAHRQQAALHAPGGVVERRPRPGDAAGRAPTAVEHWAKTLATRLRRPENPTPPSPAGDQASWRMPSVALVAGFVAMPLLIAAGLLAEWMR